MQNLLKRITSRIQSVGLSLKQQVFENNEEKIIEKLGHRKFIGKEFDKEGLRQFAYVQELGVTKKTRFLDVACGSLRLGKHLIPFLNAGGYFGVEQHNSLVESGLEHEIDSAIVAKKKPRFFITPSFDFEDLKDIDIAWANSLFSHLVEKDIMNCLVSIEKSLANGGVFYATFFEGKRNPFTQLFGSHSRVGFLYTKENMIAFGRKANLEATYVEGVKNSRSQKLMAFKKVAKV